MAGILVGSLALVTLSLCLVVAARAAVAGKPKVWALRGILLSFAALMLAVAALIGSLDQTEARLGAGAVAVTAVIPVLLAIRTRARDDNSTG